VPRLALLPEGSVPNNRSATFGKDDIPKPGDPPHDGKDDALSDQDPEHVSRNPSTILSWVKELVGVKVLGCVRDISQSNIQTNGENADGEIEPGYRTKEGQQNFG